MAMANPATTHVIEIEAGIGEPAFIPLSMGQELQPISVGKKGMWRIESPRVLDVHAFVYFDGTSLFVQSADDANAASVDGYRIGKAWTELSAPCKIEIGLARLKFRSLIVDDDSATQIATAAPVTSPFRNGSQPGNSMPVAVAPPPLSFPKTERPFRPGELAHQTDESTRFAPLDTSSGNHPRLSSGSHPPPLVNSGPMMVQGPMAEPPVQPLQFPQAMMGEGPQMAPQAPGSVPGQGQPQPPTPPGSYPGQSYPGHPPYPNGGATGPYVLPNGMAPNGMPMNGMYTHPPGPLDVLQPGMPGQAPPPPKAYDKLRAALGGTSPITAGAGILIIIAGALFVFDDDALPPKRAQAKANASATATVPSPVVGSVVMAPDAGAVVTGGAITGGQPPWPPGVPCPPPNWPAGTPLPCTPISGSAIASAVDAGAPTARPDPPSRNGKGSTPTLERQAVDFVASGDTAKAAAAYEELVRRDPNNRVYAEAARILRAKLDAGAAGP